MADRKQFLNVASADMELVKLFEATRDAVVSDEQLRRQLVSFAFGNYPLSQDIERDSVVRAAESMRLRV